MYDIYHVYRHPSDIPLILPQSDQLTLDNYVSAGLQSTETELPNTSTSAAAPQYNEAALSQLEAMGFPTVRCQKALLATGNSDPEAAMEWLIGHMDDADIDDPIQSGGAATSGPEPSAETIGMLADMGFTSAQAKKALRETVSFVKWLTVYFQIC